MKTYEGMFLLDAGAPDFEQAVQPVRDLLTRIEAEVLMLKPWDERRLAYEIRGRKRALYAITYFKADPANISSLQHDILINEKVLRAMVFSADDITQEQMNAPVPAESLPIHRPGEGPALGPAAGPGAPGAAAPAAAPGAAVPAAPASAAPAPAPAAPAIEKTTEALPAEPASPEAK
jgi:small subunit ribosomal protein S6